MGSPEDLRIRQVLQGRQFLGIRQYVRRRWTLGLLLLCSTQIEAQLVLDTF